MALQYIKLALEEAITDLDEIGRPLTFIVHDGAFPSLLSSDAEDSNGKGNPTELRGIVNLLSILLVTSNLNNILKKVHENGFRMAESYNILLE